MCFLEKGIREGFWGQILENIIDNAHKVDLPGPLLNTNELDLTLPSSIVSLLQEYEDVFLEEAPHGLPLIQGIEH